MLWGLVSRMLHQYKCLNCEAVKMIVDNMATWYTRLGVMETRSQLSSTVHRPRPHTTHPDSWQWIISYLHSTTIHTASLPGIWSCRDIKNISGKPEILSNLISRTFSLNFSFFFYSNGYLTFSNIFVSIPTRYLLLQNMTRWHFLVDRKKGWNMVSHLF